MSDPIVPNFDKNTNKGKLVTSRFDFQDHVDGYKYIHNADAINLSPNITIRGVTVTNSQDAIELLATLVNPPAINDASATTKGILKINGDIRGTADSVFVSGLQGKPISTVPPTHLQNLVYDGYSNSWGPTTSTNIFVAAGDLEGNSVLQNVISLTGRTNKVNIIADQLSWINTANPLLTQASTTGISKTLQVIGQSSTGNGNKGGTINVFGGSPGTGGLLGGVSLGLDSGNFRLIQIKEVAAGRKVLALLSSTEITSVQMPNDSGDMVIYIADTVTPPVTGSPSNGTGVYSFGGKLFVKQSDGNNFQVGSVPNPSIWGTTNEQVFSSRNTITTSTAVAQDALSFTINTTTSVNVNVIAVAKKIASIESAQFNLSIGYVRHTGSAAVIGTLTTTDQRATTGAGAWTAPTITLSGNTIKVKTGFSNTETLTWLIITQLTIITTSS